VFETAMTAFTSPALGNNNSNENDNNNNTNGVTFPQPRVQDNYDDDSMSETETLSDADFPLAGNLQFQFPLPATFPIAITHRRGLASSSTLTLAQDNHNTIRNNFRLNNNSPAPESVFGDGESLNRLLDCLRLTLAEDTVRNAIECLRDLWSIAKVFYYYFFMRVNLVLIICYYTEPI